MEVPATPGTLSVQENHELIVLRILDLPEQEIYFRLLPLLYIEWGSISASSASDLRLDADAMASPRHFTTVFQS